MNTLAAHGAMARVQPRGMPLPKTHGCIPCTLGPEGEAGHGALRYVMLAPDSGRSFFRCRECGERWVRVGGLACAFLWSRAHGLERA